MEGLKRTGGQSRRGMTAPGIIPAIGSGQESCPWDLRGASINSLIITSFVSGGVFEPIVCFVILAKVSLQAFEVIGRMEIDVESLEAHLSKNDKTYNGFENTP